MVSQKKELTPYRPLELMKDSRITKSSFDDFIGVWPNFIPKSFCDNLIKYGDSILNGDLSHIVTPLDKDLSPPGTSRGGPELMDGSEMYGGRQYREDSAFLLNYTDSTWVTQVNQFLKSCLYHYISEFTQLQKLGFVSTDQKFQKTPPGGGYHLWHHEDASYHMSQREVTWIIYLNDVEEGGETEFQYQRKRLKPTVGTVVMWPAGYTHVHRGNLVLSDKDKYILTGWYIKSGTH